MTYFIDADAKGAIQGLYTDEPGYAPIPAGAVQITDSEFAFLHAGNWSNYLLTNGSVVENSAAILQAAKNGAAINIRNLCEQSIVAGFTSSALGAPYTYPSKMTDQSNLAANVLSSTLPAAQVAGWTTQQACADHSTPPVWAYRAHTAAQIQQVGEDGKAAIMAALLKNDALQKQIAAASDIQTVEAIVW